MCHQPVCEYCALTPVDHRRYQTITFLLLFWPISLISHFKTQTIDVYSLSKTLQNPYSYLVHLFILILAAFSYKLIKPHKKLCESVSKTRRK